MNKPPKPGTVVYTATFCVHYDKVTCKVTPRRFLSVTRNWLNRHGLRWNLTIDRDNLPRGSGMAYRPENVFATRGEALGSLRLRVNAMLLKIAEALTEAEKSKSFSGSWSNMGAYDLLADLRRAEPAKNPNIGLSPNDPAWDSRWDDIEGDNQ